MWGISLCVQLQDAEGKAVCEAAEHRGGLNSSSGDTEGYLVYLGRTREREIWDEEAFVLLCEDHC